MDFKQTLIKYIVLATVIIACNLSPFIPQATAAVGCSSYKECPNYSACVNNVCEDVATICSLEPVFGNIVIALGGLIGFAFFIMLIVGGIRMLLSGGDPKAVAAAKGTLTWAVAGLAFFALSFTILLLIQAFTGVNVTTFHVCS